MALLSGNMTPNERYIAYTRALDEIMVYDTPIDISSTYIKFWQGVIG